jgi:hypothetical protein
MIDATGGRVTVRGHQGEIIRRSSRPVPAHGTAFLQL